jgi:hypothetical protein
MYILEATRTVPTPAHTSTAAVAPFRAWRDSQFRVARGPAQATIERGRMVSIWKHNNTTIIEITWRFNYQK